MSDDQGKIRLLPAAAKRARTGDDRAWLDAALSRAVLGTESADDEPAEGKRRRVMDLFVSPGRVSAKIHDEGGKPRRVELVFKPFSDSEWNKLFDLLAGEALFLAKLLAGHLPSSIGERLNDAGLSLVPAEKDGVKASIDGKRSEGETSELQPVIQKLIDLIHNDPFNLFLLRGRGKNEILHELRSRRAASRPAQTQVAPLTQFGVEHEPAPPLVAQVDGFWSWGPGIADLAFTIKADELPAAILRRLDPLPLSGLEEDIDYLVEEAYAVVARRAQAFGLGMKSN